MRTVERHFSRPPSGAERLKTIGVHDFGSVPSKIVAIGRIGGLYYSICCCIMVLEKANLRLDSRIIESHGKEGQ
jgi:hypothetical protein